MTVLWSVSPEATTLSPVPPPFQPYPSRGEAQSVNVYSGLFQIALSLPVAMLSRIALINLLIPLRSNHAPPPYFFSPIRSTSKFCAFYSFFLETFPAGTSPVPFIKISRGPE